MHSDNVIVQMNKPEDHQLVIMKPQQLLDWFKPASELEINNIRERTKGIEEELNKEGMPLIPSPGEHETHTQLADGKTQRWTTTYLWGFRAAGRVLPDKEKGSKA